MRIRSVALLLLVGAIVGSTRGEDASARGLSLKQFDSDGHLIRWLKAESVVGLARPVLSQGVLDIFDPGDASRRIARLEFNQAVYDPVAGRITGDGRVRAETDTLTVSSESFDYQFHDRRLTLGSKTKIDFPLGSATSARAEVFFAPAETNGLAVLEAALSGGVIVTQISDPRFAHLARVQAPSANYDGRTGILTTGSPIEIWHKNGEHSAATGRMSFQLGPQSLSPVNGPSSPSKAGARE